MKALRILNRVWVGLLIVLPGASQAQDLTLVLEPASTKVEISLSAFAHTVHGKFALKSGTVHFNPATGSASGLVIVDAASGNTGNDGRDHKMHTAVLESQRFTEIRFTPDKLSGTLNLQGSSDVRLEGMLSLHGDEHAATLPLSVQIDGKNLSATTHFEVPYVSWGMKNPSTFVLRVSEKVEVEITASGKLSSP
jgi:polyisoprenoid-binding protein YceI